jgi:beta-glucanase (GH16 family)
VESAAPGMEVQRGITDAEDVSDQVLRVRHNQFMKRLIAVHVGIIALTLQTGCMSLGGANGNAVTDQDYVLVWHDEFDQEGTPDPDHWGHETGFVRNEELQWYQEENAFCDDGKLIIEARRERRANPTFESGSEYWQARRRMIGFTSASLTTKGLHEWQYGRFEVRARILDYSGLWPAIWLMGSDGQWPARGEIDLMEYFRGNVLANVVWAGRRKDSVQRDISTVRVSSLGGETWDDEFHTWRMDWDEDGISLFLDNRRLNYTSLSKTRNPPGTIPANPFMQPHYLLISLAIGGTQGGDPAGTDFPSRIEVDYVRVYQQKADIL